MPVISDPEGISAEVIQNFYDFEDRQVLEIGCGKGRITFAIVDKCQHITAIDPREEDINTAIHNTPRNNKDKIKFIATGIEDFEIPTDSAKFDIALFSWSL